MLRPDEEQLRSLSRFERFAFELSDQFNRRPLLKRAAHLYLKTVGASWVHFCTKHLVHVEGLENLTGLRPDRGVLLVANHRTFFDLYVITSALLRHSSWVTQMYFPVRSTYFYERVDGIAVNALMSAMAMYPPILRDSSKRGFNQYAVEVLAEVSKRPGTVVGVHPEGTRGKGDDPYELLPAQPGVGQMAYSAKSIVVPAFILGLGNDFPTQVKSNFDGTGKPITVVIGKPIDFADLYAQDGRIRTYKRIADRMNVEIARLGEQDKAFRARMGFPSREVPKAKASKAALAAAHGLHRLRQTP